MTILLSELTTLIANKQTDLRAADVESAVAALLEQMSQALAAAERIEVRGFGAFSVRRYEARLGRNPKTGEPVSIPARHAPHFKPGQALRERVKAEITPRAID